MIILVGKKYSMWVFYHESETCWKSYQDSYEYTNRKQRSLIYKNDNMFSDNLQLVKEI